MSFFIIVMIGIIIGLSIFVGYIIYQLITLWLNK